MRFRNTTVLCLQPHRMKSAMITEKAESFEQLSVKVKRTEKLVR